mgnify:CR=1 FL=1
MTQRPRRSERPRGARQSWWQVQISEHALFTETFGPVLRAYPVLANRCWVTEFFFDKKARKLYYFHNASAGSPIPLDTKFEATKLKTIVSHNGTSTNPVAGISYVGITFTGSRIQFMDPHGVPSGPFNSWDRVAFPTGVPAGPTAPRLTPLYNPCTVRGRLGASERCSAFL